MKSLEPSPSSSPETLRDLLDLLDRSDGALRSFVREQRAALRLAHTDAAGLLSELEDNRASLERACGAMEDPLESIQVVCLAHRDRRDLLERLNPVLT